MIHGRFPIDSNLPHVHIGLVLGEIVVHPEFVLDTGFSGDLKVDERVAGDLGISVTFSGITFINANGERISTKGAHGFVEMENRRVPVKILIGDGMPLAGMGLFGAFGYRISIDCKNEEVYLERGV